jgi:hypothetical protein
MVSIYVLGWLFYEEDLPHPRLAAGTTMLQSKPMRPLYRRPHFTREASMRNRFLVPDPSERSSLLAP